MDKLFGHSTSKKSLSSEIVKYEIFIVENQSVSSRLLEDHRIECLAHATSLTKDYVWHNEGFNLAISNSNGNPCLEGATDFGDFIEDEWLVVWLLYQISEKFNVTARIKDADGEFLLIEAAEFIPKWLNVDTSKNRVFIHDGRTHIVTQPTTPGQIAKLPIGQPTLEAALRSVQHYSNLTQAHSTVEQCIRNRIGKFPESLREYVQKVNVYIPEMIARILDRDKNLMSAAIRAFYFRDPIDLKSCRVFKKFLSHTRLWSQVSMNRCGYAQLMQQIFKADKRSGYTIPKNAGNEFKGMDVGCKIAHGFEILCANCTNNTNEEYVLDENSFLKYLEALCSRDYFCGEIEGSKKHNELMSNARAYFDKFSSESVNNHGQSIAKSIGQRIYQIQQQIMDDSCGAGELLIKQELSQLPPEDSDRWMYLNDGKMDDLLSEMKHGFEKLGKAGIDLEQHEEASLSDLSEKMQAFITNFSDYEGIEHLDDNAEVKFDPLNFQNALKRLCQISEDDNHSESDDFLSSDDEVSSLEDESDLNCTIREAMQQMDAELAPTTLGKSFVKGHDVDSFKPVDIDLNLVENFLQSCESETDMTGAATTLLHSLGLKSDDT